MGQRDDDSEQPGKAEGEHDELESELRVRIVTPAPAEDPADRGKQNDDRCNRTEQRYKTRQVFEEVSHFNAVSIIRLGCPCLAG